MNKTKLFGYIAIGLLISNVSLLTFVFLKHSNPHEGPRDIIIERLHFDVKQVEEYDKLITKHRADISKKQSEMMELKNKLYGNLSGNLNSVISDSLETEIGKLEIAIEKINYSHFEDIRHLCNENQKSYFNDLIKDIARLFERPKPGPDKR